MEGTMFAFITRKQNWYHLEIRTSSDLSRGELVKALDGLTKRECLAWAREYNARPWNFS